MKKADLVVGQHYAVSTYDGFMQTGYNRPRRMVLVDMSSGWERASGWTRRTHTHSDLDMLGAFTTDDYRSERTANGSVLMAPVKADGEVDRARCESVLLRNVRGEWEPTVTAWTAATEAIAASKARARAIARDHSADGGAIVEALKAAGFISAGYRGGADQITLSRADARKLLPAVEQAYEAMRATGGVDCPPQ